MELSRSDDQYNCSRIPHNLVLPPEQVSPVFDFSADDRSGLRFTPTRDCRGRKFTPNDPCSPQFTRDGLCYGAGRKCCKNDGDVEGSFHTGTTPILPEIRSC